MAEISTSRVATIHIPSLQKFDPRMIGGYLWELWYQIDGEKWRIWEEKNMIFLENWILSSLRDENTFISPRGGLVRLFGLLWDFTPNLCPSPQKKISDQAHPLHWKNRTSKSRKIDFFEKNFEKILKVQKFRWSRSGRNFWWQGRTPQDHKFSGFQSWNIPRKTRKVTIIQSYEAFVQKPHFWTSWRLVTLSKKAYIFSNFEIIFLK